MPRRKCASMVSSNFAVAVFLTSSTASLGPCETLRSTSSASAFWRLVSLAMIDILSWSSRGARGPPATSEGWGNLRFDLDAHAASGAADHLLGRLLRGAVEVGHLD